MNKLFFSSKRNGQKLVTVRTHGDFIVLTQQETWRSAPWSDIPLSHGSGECRAVICTVRWMPTVCMTLTCLLFTPNVGTGRHISRQYCLTCEFRTHLSFSLSDCLHPTYTRPSPPPPPCDYENQFFLTFSTEYSVYNIYRMCRMYRIYRI